MRVERHFKKVFGEQLQLTEIKIKNSKQFFASLGFYMNGKDLEHRGLIKVEQLTFCSSMPTKMNNIKRFDIDCQKK